MNAFLHPSHVTFGMGLPNFTVICFSCRKPFPLTRAFDRLWLGSCTDHETFITIVTILAPGYVFQLAHKWHFNIAQISENTITSFWRPFRLTSLKLSSVEQWPEWDYETMMTGNQSPASIALTRFASHQNVNCIVYFFPTFYTLVSIDWKITSVMQCLHYSLQNRKICYSTWCFEFSPHLDRLLHQQAIENSLSINIGLKMNQNFWSEICKQPNHLKSIQSHGIKSFKRCMQKSCSWSESRLRINSISQIRSSNKFSLLWFV